MGPLRENPVILLGAPINRGKKQTNENRIEIKCTIHVLISVPAPHHTTPHYTEQIKTEFICIHFSIQNLPNESINHIKSSHCVHVECGTLFPINIHTNTHTFSVFDAHAVLLVYRGKLILIENEMSNFFFRWFLPKMTKKQFLVYYSFIHIVVIHSKRHKSVNISPADSQKNNI